MRIGTKISLLGAVLVCGIWFATRDGDSKSEQKQEAGIEEGYTLSGR